MSLDSDTEPCEPVEPEECDEASSHEAYIQRIARMTREQFVEYVIANPEEFANQAGHSVNDLRGSHAMYFGFLIRRRPEFRGLNDDEYRKYENNFNAREAHVRWANVIRAIVEEWNPKRNPQTWSGGPYLTDARFDQPGDIFVRGFTSWTFGHFDTTDEETRIEKGYITLAHPLEQFSATAVSAMVNYLRDSGFRGALKFQNCLNSMAMQFDNIVIHSDDAAALEKAVSDVVVVLETHGVQVSGTDRGFDEKGEPHSSILALRMYEGLQASSA